MPPKLFRETIEYIQRIASEEFSRLHGSKMCGPHNETERALLEISSVCIATINAINAHGDAQLSSALKECETLGLDPLGPSPRQ